MSKFCSLTGNFPDEVNKKIDRMAKKCSVDVDTVILVPKLMLCKLARSKKKCWPVDIERGGEYLFSLAVT